MTAERSIITSRNDKSQVLHYHTPGFNMLADRSIYASEVSISLPEHWHEDLEFIYVIEGRMFFSVNGEEIILKQGEGIFVNSKRIHSNGSPIGEQCVFYYVLAHPSIISSSPYIEQKYINPLLGAGSVDYLILSDRDWTKEVKDAILNTFSNPHKDTTDIRAIENCFLFLRLLQENCPPDTTKLVSVSSYSNNFKAMVTYIGEHYSEKLSLEEIAAAGNVGKTLCAKIFKQFSSKTPGDYLIHYRIDKSTELLANTNLSITEIAFHTGFNSASHYAKTFRDMIGCTPNHYRFASYRKYTNGH